VERVVSEQRRAGIIDGGDGDVDVVAVVRRVDVGEQR